MSFDPDVRFVSPLRLEPVDGKREWIITDDFAVRIDARLCVIPAGDRTDLASVPAFARPVIDDDAPDMIKPSVLHDRGYARLGRLWPDRDPFTRAQMDTLLVAGMKTMGASWLRRRAVWLAVRLGGWVPWNKHQRENRTTLAMMASVHRSPRWWNVREKHLRSEPWCRFCGGTLKLEVHHVKPFHLFPHLELDPTNLITLCEAKGLNCHLMRGHLGNWHQWNPNIREQAIKPRP